MKPRTREFKTLAVKALADPGLQKAIATANRSFFASRAAAVAAVPEWEALRERSARIKDEALDRLPECLEALERRIAIRGGTVHWAETGDDACRLVIDIARRAGARLAVKSKSMVGEEIGLNHALEGAGIESVETDLGEFIV